VKHTHVGEEGKGVGGGGRGGGKRAVARLAISADKQRRQVADMQQQAACCGR
jgi:hypothetical protein